MKVVIIQKGLPLIYGKIYEAQVSVSRYDHVQVKDSVGGGFVQLRVDEDCVVIEDRSPGHIAMEASLEEAIAECGGASSMFSSMSKEPAIISMLGLLGPNGVRFCVCKRKDQ